MPKINKGIGTANDKGRTASARVNSPRGRNAQKAAPHPCGGKHEPARRARPLGTGSSLPLGNGRKGADKSASRVAEYNHAYYLAHKDDAAFKARRKRNQKNRRPMTPAEKRRRNAHLRARWASEPEFRKNMMATQSAYARRRYANDPQYRRRLLDYQKAYRAKRKALRSLRVARQAKRTFQGGK